MKRVYKPLTSLQKMYRNLLYDVVGVGRPTYTGTYYYVLVNEVEHIITKKPGWIATLCRGGGWVAVELYETTEVLQSEKEALYAGKSLLRSRIISGNV